MDTDTDIERLSLLSEPSLMVLALKLAREAPIMPADCVRQLLYNFREIHEDAPEALLPEIGRRVIFAIRDLCIAGLLDPDEAGRCAITQRGRDILETHPHGVDASVLVRFPEYRSYVRRPMPFQSDDREHEPGKGPAVEYMEGYTAYVEGRRFTENPYQIDSVAHLAWENGWCEARDDLGMVEATRSP
jgi:ribosome modulation factor